MDNRSQEFLAKAKDILKKITFSGGEGYIIGSSVLKIINEENLDKITIYINLEERLMYELFKDYNIIKINEGIYQLGYLGFTYDILTDKSLQENKIKTLECKKHYSKLLSQKMKEMDYTIYALALNQNNVVFDFFYGKKDIEKGIVRSIYYGIKAYFDLKPIKMLDAIKVVSQTGYKLDTRLFQAIKSKRKKIKKVPLNEVATIMYEIYRGKYFKKALKILVKTKLYKNLEWYKDVIFRLYKRYRKETDKFFLGYEMVKRKKYEPVIGNTADNEYELQMFVNLAITNPTGKYDKLTLYTYGVQNCVLANRINFLLGKAKKQYKKIRDEYNKLPIKKTCDLAFKGEDIMSLGSYSPECINEILDEVIDLILNEKIKNEKEILKDFILNKLNGYDNSNEVYANGEKIIKQINENESIDVITFKRLQKQQEEFHKRLLELEVKDLEREIDYEVRKKIDEGKILENVIPEQRKDTYDSLYNSYYEFLLKTEKYSKLKQYKSDKKE